MQTSWQHYKEGGESTGGEESGEVKTDLEKIRKNQSKDKGTDVGSAKESDQNRVCWHRVTATLSSTKELTGIGIASISFWAKDTASWL